MCGICGQYRRDGGPVAAEELRRMTSTLIHRGPDDEGYHLDGSVGLGFRRLSIIDLQGGHQPMSDREESVWVVFNGEIYNFRELRRELEGLGHSFRTRSDTEVIIQGYKRWGEQVLEHLNGMFGLALWDSKKRKLLLARDRLGIKPLYYRLTAGSLLFGSELRSILSVSGQAAQVDRSALYLFLRYRYTPAPLTIFQGIRKLAPGTKLVLENGAAREERWWRFEPRPLEPGPSFREAGEELLRLYRQAVKRQLVSDVPLGLLLSGGVDSALLLALMNEHGRSWNTFTVGYGESFAEDELEDARHTARLLGSRHHPVLIDRERFERDLPTVVRHLEEPIASASILPMYFVSQRARAEVKVALIGQGPDELFGGYTRHLGVRYGSWWRALPAWLREPAKRLLPRLDGRESLARALYSLDQAERLERYRQVFSIVPGGVVDGLFADGRPVADRLLECWRDLLPLAGRTDELGGLQFFELRSSLPDELLMYADKLSMAHGLELRVPYLDHDIVEFVERLPAAFKVHLGRGKRLHRRLCRDYLEPLILKRRKRGFAVKVVDQWFRESLSERMQAALVEASSPLFEHLSREAVGELLRQHRLGQRDNHKILFSLVVFEQWLRVFQGEKRPEAARQPVTML